MLTALLALSACDSSTAPSGAGDAPNTAASLTGDLQIKYVSGDLDLRTFASGNAFDEAAAAVRERALATGSPVLVHESLRPYGDHPDFAPPEELALADEAGRVVIGDRTYQLGRGGEPSSTVTLTSTGQEVERFYPGGTPNAGVINPNNERAFGCTDYGQRTLASGATRWVRASYSHASWISWTRLRMNAKTEILTSTIRPTNSSDCKVDQPRFVDARPSDFPNAFVGARVVGKDEGLCTDKGAYGNRGQVFVEARDSRGPGTKVSYSEHWFTPSGGTIASAQRTSLDNPDEDSCDDY
ncbi:hypothetical protein [Rubrivirga sp.]|uniref:hypothetical protein n=1 Tax=Rubrivirga sp. TaxID=1885344 RepID=UPI003B5274E7